MGLERTHEEGEEDLAQQEADRMAETVRKDLQNLLDNEPNAEVVKKTWIRRIFLREPSHKAIRKTITSQSQPLVVEVRGLYPVRVSTPTAQTLCERIVLSFPGQRNDYYVFGANESVHDELDESSRHGLTVTDYLKGRDYGYQSLRDWSVGGTILSLSDAKQLREQVIDPLIRPQPETPFPLLHREPYLLHSTSTILSPTL